MAKKKIEIYSPHYTQVNAMVYCVKRNVAYSLEANTNKRFYIVKYIPSDYKNVVYLKENNTSTYVGAALSANVTGNISTGWVSAAVDIDAIDNGTTIKTKTIRFNLGTTTYQNNELIVRYYVPYQTSGNYARTFTTCGSNSYEVNSMFTNYSKVVFESIGGSSTWRTPLATISGNQTTKPGIAPIEQWNVVTSYENDAIALYAPPAPGAIPWTLFKWHIKNVPSRKIIEMVGDSIMQGYGDQGDILNIGGISRRANLQFNTLSGGYWFVNEGQSGFTPEQYLERWEGIAKTTSATAMVYSIYSPNGYYNAGTPIYPQRIIDMQNNCILAESKAAQYGRIFIPCFITNNNMFNYGSLGTSGTVWGYSGQALELLDWAKARYGNRLLDLTPAIQNPNNNGLSMDTGYTDDQTHPNTAGYGVLGTKFIADFPTVYANCLAAI